jgi:hypothetical protein
MARYKETGEYLGAARRFIRAAGARVADADEPELAQLMTLYSDLDAAVVIAIRGMRDRGCSWAYIARGLGTTRQAAQMRWGKAVEEAQAS